MKKIFLTILLLFYLAFCLNAQYIYFNKRISITSYNDVCRGIVLTKDGYLVAGGQASAIVGIYMSKINLIGNLEWTQYYENPSYTYYFGLSGALFKTWDSNYAICGTRVPGPRSYGLLIKVDSLGNKKWEKDYTILDDDGFNSGIITKDSGFIITGDAAILGWPGYRYLLLKTDSLGNLQWYQTYTDNHPQRSYQGRSVVQTADMGYCFGGGGRYNSMGNYYQIAEIFKTDNLGNLKWEKTYGNPLFLNSFMMINDAKDSCIVGSYCLGFSSAQYENKQLYVVKLDTNGNEKWNKKIGNLAMNMCPLWIETISDKSIVIGGGHYINTFGRYVGWLFKLNKNGDSIWYREYSVIDGANDANQLWQFAPTPDKGFAAAGSLYPNSSGGNQDIWVFKTDSLGCLVPNCHVGITEFNPNTGAQMLVYPNPFTEAFAINYNIPKENKEAVFQLYDIYGKLVYQIGLTNSVNQLQVVASSLKAGMYVGCLVVDGVQLSSQKIIKE